MRLILDGPFDRLRVRRGARAAGPESDRHLGLGGAGRAAGRPEGSARPAQHGRGERGGLASLARRPGGARAGHARAVDPRVEPEDRWRPWTGGGAERPVAAGAGAALHGPQAPQPAGPCPQETARRDRRRLHRHDLRRHPSRRWRPPSASSGRTAFLRKWRRKCQAVADSLEEAGQGSSPSCASRPSSGSRSEPQTPSNACRRSSSGGSRRSACSPAPRPLACRSGRCWPADRSSCPRSMAGTPSTSPSPTNSWIRPPDQINMTTGDAAASIFHQPSDTTDVIVCPYCGTRFRFDSRWGPLEADPPDSLYVTVLI